MVALGSETPECRQWADVYDGREGFAFYGHEPFQGPFGSDHATGLDTGCVFGNFLAAAVLEPGQPPGKADIVLVPAVKAHVPGREIDPVSGKFMLPGDGVGE
jgi:hypothetical protein